MRQLVEFYCQECRKYFDVKLNMSLNGNHRVHCPNCGHIHFRMITDGQITEARFTQNQNDEYIVDDLRPMKACCRDERKETTEEAAPSGAGFLKRLWSERFSTRV